MDVASEDTPLSLRQMSSAERRGKRLTLFTAEEPSEEGEVHLNSTEESHEEERIVSRNQRLNYSATGSENEKQDEHQDGVRRSQRTKKFMYASYNDSWIFNEKTAKVKFSPQLYVRA